MPKRKEFIVSDQKRKQRKFSPEFKLNVVLESYVRGNVSATAERNEIHVSQLNSWRKQLLRQGAKTFLPERKRKPKQERKIDQLEKIIGRLTIQNEILKKTQELLG